jgi:Secretion system C-terminal sorting domain/NHL repeat
MIHHLRSKVLCASVLMALSYSTAQAQGTIYTLSGTGTAGFAGDGGPAALAQYSSPAGVATDAAGNVYVADQYNHRIRMINTLGVVSTVVGSGSGMYSGMGGPATLAGMEYPNSVFSDASGNLSVTDFFADCSYGINHSTATITNTCGHNHQGNDDECDGPSGSMELPRGIWKDHAGNTLIADYGNNRIRRVDAVTNRVTTVTGLAGHGFSPDGTPAAACQWGSIMGVCVDAYGVIYVADGGNHVVRAIDASGMVHTVVGNGVNAYSGDGGVALSASLMSPGGLFVNAAGNLFICDPASNVVRVVNIYYPGSIIKTLAGNGTAGFSGEAGIATHAQLNQPSGVWESNTGTIYIADMGNNRVRYILRSGYKGPDNVGNVTALGTLNIYPNPSNGSFSVFGTALPDNTTLEVYNMLGAKVHTETLTQQQTTVNLNVPSGMYNLILKGAGTQVSQKIVIEK